MERRRIMNDYNSPSNVYRWNDVALEEWKQLQETTDWLQTEWKSFINAGQLKPDSRVAPEIYSSWIRCRNREIDPFDDAPVILPQNALDRKLAENKQLIKILVPLFHDVAETFKDTGFRINLYDKHLYLLMRFGKRINKGDSDRRDILPGTSQREEDAGTTAVNLAALLEQPLQVQSYEHYKTCYHHLTCVAAPIIHHGQLAAVIELAGNCWPMHKLTLGLLTSLKNNIEYRLSKNTSNTESVLSVNINRELIEMIDEATVVANGCGKIILTNKSANQLLCKGWQDVVGFSCESVWGKNNLFSEVLNSKEEIINREVTMNVEDTPTKLFGTVRLNMDESGKITNIIGTFKETNSGIGKSRSDSRFKAHYTFENLVGESFEIRQAIRLARETAKMHSNILILGESGTGKELFAQSIHNTSPYKMGPFVAVNCSAIPNGLLESELFGYEGGSFTGAKKEGGMGKFELAAGGTIFLDEINSMTQDMQVKLLRVIQSRTLMRIGGTKEISIHVRIIASSNVDLWDMVKKGQFREDLYYRINVVAIYIPPLRERHGDIDILIDYLINKLSDQLKKEVHIDDNARQVLKSYNWPGNVRELENVLEKSIIMARVSEQNNITLADIFTYRGIKEFNERNTLANMNASYVNATGMALSNINRASLDMIEKEMIERVLKENNCNLSITAKQLGIARNTLYSKIKRYSIIYHSAEFYNP